jgi:hypothetical protein
VHLVKRLAAAAVLVTALPLSACSAQPAAGAHVVVRVAPSAHPEGYEVQLAAKDSGFSSTIHMRSGQTRRIAVPKGWVTVRVAGLCVVPTPASGTTTVDVRPNDCRIA